MEDPLRILVTGASGLLGRAIMKLLKERNFSPIGLAFSRMSEDLLKCDLKVDGQFETLMKDKKPHVIVHSAAERFPDKVEKNYDESKYFNVNISGKLAAIAGKEGSRFIYISTDYVFDGKNPPYSTDDVPNPLNKYGVTKFLGEKSVLESNKDACILRVPVMYGEIQYLEESAVTTLLKSILDKVPQSINHSQRRYPCHTRDIAAVLCDLIRMMQKGKDVSGIYQWSGKKMFTKYDMAVNIAENFGLSHDHLTADSTPSTDTNRPHDCLMSNKRVEDFGISYNTDFSQGIKEALQKFV